VNSFLDHDSRFLSRERPMRGAGSPVPTRPDPSRPAHLRQIPRVKGCLRPVVVDTGMSEYRDTRTLTHLLLPASLPAHPGIPSCPRRSLRGAGMPGMPGCRHGGTLRGNCGHEPVGTRRGIALSSLGGINWAQARTSHISSADQAGRSAGTAALQPCSPAALQPSLLSAAGLAGGIPAR
jgi:hypothetical protein